MSFTTVLLADLPPMLEDMISRMLEERSGAQVIRGGKAEGDLIAAATAAGAQVVVVSRSDPTDLAAIDPHLARAANISIVALALDGTSACLHAMRPTSSTLEDVSAEQILAAIAPPPRMART